MELLAAEGIRIPPSRRAGVWKSETTDEDRPDNGDNDADHDQAELRHHHEGDPHIWLSPDNGVVIVTLIEHELSTIDPDNAEHYRNNAEHLRQRIRQLDATLAQRLSAVGKQPYIVFHDAYQAFEKHYGLNAIGSVTLTPDRMPGAKRLHQLRKRIDEQGARCLFSEPQFKPKLIHTLVDGTEAKSGLLDPLGSDLTAGPDAYFELMENLADALVNCLGR